MNTFKVVGNCLNSVLSLSFITDNLLSREAGLTGVVLLTREGVCVYRYGTLANEEKEVLLYHTATSL